jgi:hypothetical protein
MLTLDGSHVELKPGGWEHFTGTAKSQKKRPR